ncbi:MAG TPA: T9SS type A sorting domain-containing protein, partial [Bacteroidales bacterium]|nr:T9SS type A sorting domain-containing protein [Bacteroidales bacterium]
VYMDNVKGIKIYYCDFINSRDNSVLAESRGNAISTTAGTKFTVLGALGMTNYIQGFNYAINSYQPAAASIKRTNFNNNYRGVYLVSPTTPIVESNNFNAYDFANSSSYNSSDPNTYPYGCYIYGNGTNTAFTFESNVVTAESPALGLYVNNSGYNGNIVRDNVFQGQSSSNKIFYSCINLAKNSDWNGAGGTRGLQYRCNIFENYFSALSVVDGNIRRVQGDYVLNNITTYAGNGFDRSTIFTEGDFYVDLNIVPSTLDLGNYTYCSNAEGLVNGYYHKLQNYLSIPVGKVNNIFGTYYETTHCEESTKDGVIIQTLISASEGSELLSQIDNEKVLMEYDLAVLIDNGNTTQLLTEVENVNPISDDEVSEKVANAEGYISDEVALTYLENDNANQYAKAEALLANSPLPSNIVAEIENAPMDDNLKSLLILNQNGINAREAKEMQIGEMHQNRSLVVNAMVRGYWDENASEENRSQLKDFLVSDNEILSQQHLFDIYLYEKNYTAASECLAKIEDLAYICDMDYIIELENNNNVLRLMMEIEQGNISLDEAVAQNIDLLRSMKSENEVAGSVYAAILLDKARIEPMTEVIRLPEPAVEQKNAIVDKSSNFNTSFSDLVNIYPNPASDFVYVEYILTDVNNYKSVNLYNASGSLIKSYPVSQKAGYVKIDVNGLSAGTYVVSIGENGGKFSKQIVVK